MRKCVTQFTKAMSKKLAANSYKHGWKGCTRTFLVDKLMEEVTELILALYGDEDCVAPAFRTGKPDLARIRGEAADVGNIAMMIADNWGDLAGREQS